MSDEFNVVRASDVKESADGQPRWLIESLWGAGAVGVIGGAPKCGKTWLALEMATAVASGRPCLGRFAVAEAAPVLVYAAEDAPPQVRERLENLAQARGVDFATLDVRLIVEPSLRIDRAEDLGRLRATVARHRPRLLVLEPYVRLQNIDENDARQVSAILGALRELSRAFELALVLVHHARKAPAGDLGQALRGSSDFHAWGDSNLYLQRRGDGIVLSIEHRAAAAPPSVGLSLADDGPVRLEVRDLPAGSGEGALAERIVRALSHGPRRLEDLRSLLRVRKQELCEALRDLEASGRVRRTDAGWSAAA